MQGPPMMPQGMDPRMLQQLQQQMQQQQQQAGQQQEESRTQAREKANPVPAGRAGLQTLRALSECPIPQEAGQIKKLLDKLLTLQIDDVDAPLKVVGEGIASVIMADVYCAKYKTSRPAVRFEDDEELHKIHTDFHDLQARLNELQAEIAEVAQATQAKQKERWEAAIKKFGLAPEKFTYELDEEQGTIFLVDLKCNECVGRAKTRKARQEVAEKLVTFEKLAKEEKDDGPGTGSDESDPQSESSGDDGKASTPEQEVPSVDAPATDDDSDGDNSSDKTT